MGRGNSAAAAPHWSSLRYLIMAVLWAALAVRRAVGTTEVLQQVAVPWFVRAALVAGAVVSLALATRNQYPPPWRISFAAIAILLLANQNGTTVGRYSGPLVFVAEVVAAIYAFAAYVRQRA